jgi:FlaA1/EpsC-like NDP-sugar epimerase
MKSLDLRSKLIDSCFWIPAILLAYAIDKHFQFINLRLINLLQLLGLGIIATIFNFVGLYIVEYKAGLVLLNTFDQLVREIIVNVFSGVFLLVVYFIDPQGKAISAGSLTSSIGLEFLYTFFLFTLTARKSNFKSQADGAKKVLIFGAGDAGIQAVSSMLDTSRKLYIPVGFLDDDPNKRTLKYRGVHVLGSRSALISAVKATGADTLLLATPSVNINQLEDIIDTANKLKLTILNIPPLNKLYPEITLQDVRAFRPEDLLGGGRFNVNLDKIEAFIRNKRILITGAGGSIGSELCRQINKLHPSKLYMLDRDESLLHSLELSIANRALLNSPNFILADIRDHERICNVVKKIQPDIVFHAAALKHLPLLEYNPGEAYKTNVLGTLNLVKSAAEINVGYFVNVSTDKAADPKSVLGISKHIAERIVASYGRHHKNFISVRFGNVLGSRGSALETFLAQINNGGPVTITDPEVSRFFMTIEEAVALMLEAVNYCISGEVAILDMGEPIKIVDLVQKIMNYMGKEVPIEYTGLRAGEKLNESLVGKDEVARPTSNPSITTVSVPPLDLDKISYAENLADTDYEKLMNFLIS